MGELCRLLLLGMRVIWRGAWGWVEQEGHGGERVGGSRLQLPRRRTQTGEGRRRWRGAYFFFRRRRSEELMMIGVEQGISLRGVG